MPLLAALSPSQISQEKASMTSVSTSSALREKATPPSPSSSSTLLSASGSGTGSIEAAPMAPFPIALLTSDSISDAMAARLTTCLVGHILFLKSQIPYPVSQYPRMSQMQGDAKTMKKQDDFFSTFDVLTSHLSTTFTTLAASLTPSHLSSVHVAIVIGPNTLSMAAARARILLRLDGFKSPERQLPRRGRPRTSLNGNLKENLVFEDSDDSDNDSDATFDGPLFDDEYLERHAVPHEADSDDVESVPDSDFEGNAESEEECSEGDDLMCGEIEADLRAGERTLSKALAIANGEATQSMSADLRPMHIHVLLRAPRRFPHPCWTPQQNMSRDMDALLEAFDMPPPTPREGTPDALQDITNNSKASPNASKAKNPKAKYGVKTECVNVRCQGWTNDDDKAVEKDKDSEDEMIWWSWNEKLEGFELA